MDQTPYIFAGHCDDEVTFKFDNTDKQLFVSRNFLSLVSPVFRVMLTSDFLERSTGVVDMKDKEYDNVLELLLVLHPFNQITETNVYAVLQLADQYEINSVIKRCNSALILILRTKFKVIDDNNYNDKELAKTEAVYSCITVLSTALLYACCQDVQDMALKIIAKFGSDVFLKEELVMSYGDVYDENIWEIVGDGLKNRESEIIRNAEFKGFFGRNTSSWKIGMPDVVVKRKACRDAFKLLPDDIKMTILQNRLGNIEDNTICAIESM